MKRMIFSMTMAALLTAWQSNVANQSTNQKQSSMQTEKSAIDKLLFSYRDALNNSAVNEVLPLYTKDGVFMPTNAPTATGPAQLKEAYEFVFKTIQLHIEFFVDEVVVNSDYAFATTHSKGTTLIHATGQTVAEENRELFVLQKVDGQWKIARYMFNKTK